MASSIFQTARKEALLCQGRQREPNCLNSVFLTCDVTIVPVRWQSAIFDEISLTDLSLAESGVKNANNVFQVSRGDGGDSASVNKAWCRCSCVYYPFHAH